ncbi:MAG: acyl-CoA thioesterase [Clostridia bacterium]|nr:acyl-CoA thioesterase [Clostridia bacterium]
MCYNERITVKEKEDVKPYTHKVKYYETDKMGITHHSNYIRWMEEARLDFLEQLGWGYEKLEEEGMISPVTAIECRYKASTTFPDKIEITVSVSEFKAAVLKLSYLMKNQSGDTVFEGRSEHCFLNKEGRIIRLKREYPEFCDLLISLTEENSDA